MRTFWTLTIFTAARMLGADPDYATPLAAKDYEKALGILEQQLKAEPASIKWGSEYRMAIIAAKQHDRAIKFFESLAEASPKSNAFLNLGFAYVDKIPTAGSISQVLLANTSLGHFTKAVEIEATWIALYTRGNSYLFWPKIFKRVPLGIADLENALAVQKAGRKRPYHSRVYIALGDGYWKNDEPEKAKRTWTEGAREFPDHAALKSRLTMSPEQLNAAVTDVYDPNKRVDTNLAELWKDMQ
jgi:tetratricopeptide (TPR) repeat protein